MNLNLALCLAILPLIAAVSLHRGARLTQTSPSRGHSHLLSHLRSLIPGTALGDWDVRVWQHELDELWDLGEAACQQVDELES